MLRSIAVATLVAAASPAVATQRVIFRCPDRTVIEVAFDTSDPHAPAVVLPHAGRALTLAAQPSGSGFLYSDGRHALRGKGDAVTWSGGGIPPITCTAAEPAKR